MRRTIRTLSAAALLTGGLVLLAPAPAQAAAVSPPLGAAANFAVLGGSTVTNTGSGTITGGVGVSPGTAIVGFPPGTVHADDPAATAAQGDVATAYAFAAGQTCDHNLSGQDLGGMTLTPAVYCFNSSAQLTGALHLDAQRNPNAAWLFQITSTLTTASASAVVVVNCASPCNNNNVTWQVGSSATVGTATSFVGNMLANTSITFDQGANSTGGLYAHTGAVTMDGSDISTPAPASAATSTPPSALASTSAAASSGTTGATKSEGPGENRAGPVTSDPGTTSATTRAGGSTGGVGIGDTQTPSVAPIVPATPNYLLVVVAFILVVGVGWASLRAIFTQHRSRRALA